LGYFCYFQKAPQSKKMLNRRKFAQSVRPGYTPPPISLKKKAATTASVGGRIFGREQEQLRRQVGSLAFAFRQRVEAFIGRRRKPQGDQMSCEKIAKWHTKKAPPKDQPMVVKFST
jgi:hypothetical protein